MAVVALYVVEVLHGSVLGLQGTKTTTTTTTALHPESFRYALLNSLSFEFLFEHNRLVMISGVCVGSLPQTH